MNVAKGVTRAFEASGMSLTEFAKRARVPLSTAHGWVHGTHGIRTKKLPRIARVLGVTVPELFA